MNRKILNRFLGRFGYEVSKKRPHLDPAKEYELHQYLKDDGSFDYEEYKKTQVAANKKKVKQVWAKEENISFVSEHLKSHISSLNFGICHGSRRGQEQEWFRKCLACDVIGTEISDTATHFPHTIQWDFHEVKPEWKNAVDFIYSNSFDHSYNPEKCLNAWMSCIRSKGLCVIEHSGHDSHATVVDPFGASIAQMPYLILRWGQGDYWVRELVEAPYKPSYIRYLYFLIIEKR